MLLCTAPLRAGAWSGTKNCGGRCGNALFRDELELVEH